MRAIACRVVLAPTAPTLRREDAVRAVACRVVVASAAPALGGEDSHDDLLRLVRPNDPDKLRRASEGK